MWINTENIYKIHDVFNNILNQSLGHIFQYVTEKKENYIIGKEIKYLFIELINTDAIDILKSNLQQYIGLLKVNNKNQKNINIETNQNKI